MQGISILICRALGWDYISRTNMFEIAVFVLVLFFFTSRFATAYGKNVERKRRAEYRIQLEQFKKIEESYNSTRQHVELYTLFND